MNQQNSFMNSGKISNRKDNSAPNFNSNRSKEDSDRQSHSKTNQRYLPDFMQDRERESKERSYKVFKEGDFKLDLSSLNESK